MGKRFEKGAKKNYYNFSFFRVKSITLQISQADSALHEQLSSHFFKSSHSLKFFNSLRSSFLILLRWFCSSSLSLSARPPISKRYPFCHMNTSCRSAFLFLRANSSSNVTIFSRGLGAAFLGTLTVNGSILATGVSPAAPDKSNSLTLRGTKYSMRGSAPAKDSHFNKLSNFPLSLSLFFSDLIKQY